MGYIYFPYAVIVSVLVFLECRKYKQARWWPAVCFLFPPIVPYIIFRTRKGTGIVLIMIFLMTFSLTIGGEFFLFNYKEKKRMTQRIPPIIREVIKLNEDIKRTTIDIYNATGKLDSMSMVQSRVTDIKKMIGLISDLRQTIQSNQEAIDRLLLFIEDHNDYFYRKNLDWIFAIRNFYTDHHVLQHHKSRSNYYASFETLLTYTFKNFQNIMELKSQQHMKSYDIYYLRYRRAADSHNRFNRKRIEFQTAFIREYPEVAPFLPGAHHLEPFKFWDRFSF